MTTYRVTHKETGRTFVMRGDSPPTAADIEAAAKALKVNTGVELDPSEMLRNTPESAMNLAKDFGMAVLNPIDTVHNLGRLADGALDKAGVQIPGTEDNREVTDAVVQGLKDRYGSWDSTKRTLNTDPVGALADAAGLVTGGAAAAAKMGVKGAGTVAKYATAVDPVNLATRGATRAAQAATKPLLRNVDPGAMYAEGMKLPAGMDGRSPGTRARLGQTALDYKIEPDAGGFARLKALQDDFDTVIENTIDAAGSAGTKLNSNVLVRRLQELRAERIKNPNLEAKQDTALIDEFIDKVRGEQERLGRLGWTPEEMQGFKRSTYRQTEYGTEASGARETRNDARKAVARGAKETLEALGPDIKDLNREWGRLIELEKPLAQASARMGNNNPLSLDTLMAGSAGGAAGGGKGFVLMSALRQIVNDPKNRRRLARLVNTIKNGGPSLAGRVDAELLRYATVLAGRTDEELEELGLFAP